MADHQLGAVQYSHSLCNAVVKPCDQLVKQLACYWNEQNMVVVDGVEWTEHSQAS